MGDASNLQTSFIGGEWSPYAQGRADEKDYRNAMNVCLNSYPLEAGAWARRQGFRFCATTLNGQPGWLLDFAFANNSPYTMEFTNQMLRLFNGPELVSTNDPQVVVSASSADPSVITTKLAHGWSNGDQVQFLFPLGASYPLAAALMNRQFVISVASGVVFSISDPITGLGIDGSTITLSGSVIEVARVLAIASPYMQTQLPSVNKVQAEGTVVTLAPGVVPWSLVQATAPSASAFATFTYAASVFTDGPYLDPNKTGTITPSAKTGSITLSGAPAATFVSTDVGRFIRLYSEPPVWAVGTAYTVGNPVKYNGLYYSALASSTGEAPDQYPTLWGANLAAAIWTWAKITAVGSDTSVTATIMGIDLLYTSAITMFRLGVYTAAVQPTCGVYHEGRLWLAGAVGNRFDASNSNQPFNMSPTAADGTVGDANAISYTLNAEDVNQIFWMLPDANGIVAGTQGGEWIIAASALNDPLTPTSIQAHRRSKYKAANAPAVHTGMSLVFIQAQARKLIEYMADVFTAKFLGRNLNEKSRHLTTAGLAQIAYQQEINPVLWGRNKNGSLIGSTYKRESLFPSEPPTMNGWHRHTLGSGRLVESIAVGPSVNGDLESMSAITNDPATGIRHVEIMVDGFDETDTILDAWFLDDAVTPIAAVESGNTIQFFGMEYLVGKLVTVWAGGLDLGDFTVAADGSVTVPINAAGSLFTDAFMAALNASGEDFGDLGVFINRTVNVQYPVGSGNLIQSYLMTQAPDGFVDDYANNQVYAVKRGGGATCALAIFNRLTGVKKLERTGDSIFGAGSGFGIDPGASGPIIIGGDGYLYLNGTNANSSALIKLNAKTLDYVGTFGAAGGNSNSNTTMIHMQDGVVMNARGNYLVMVGSAFADIGVYNVDLMEWSGHNAVIDGTANNGVCAGPVINLPHNRGSFATAYTASKKNDGSQFSLYNTTIDGNASFGYNNPISTTGGGATTPNLGITTTLIDAILPGEIDVLWTVISAIEGPLYDPLDGNVILFVSSALAVATEYAVKINVITGAVMWATAVAWDGQSLPYGLDKTKYITNGLLSYLTTAGTSTLRTLNTSTGAIVDTTALASVAGNYSSCCDRDGSIISYGTWTGATLTGLNGTVSFSTNVFKIQGFTGFPGDTTETQGTVIPVVIGFTYTSQGQMLRGIAADATGAHNGPALGKTRRDHRYAVLLANAQGLSFGTDFAKMNPVILQTPGGTNLAINILKTGVHTQTLTDRHSYDGMLCWQVSRPYPATVASAENFLAAQDR